MTGQRRRGFCCGLVGASVLALVGCGVDPGADGGFVCDGVIGFEDDALVQELRIALGWDPEGEAPPPELTYARLLELRTLDASEAGITSLEGLQCVQGIDQLSIAGNEVVDLEPVGALRGLRQFDASRNPIRSIEPLERTRRLERLVLRSGEVDDLSPLAGSEVLEHLDLTGNAVTSVSALGEVNSLQTLVLTDNQVSDVGPLANLPNLVALVLDRNEIEDIEPLRGLVNLYTIDLDVNRIRDLSPLEGMWELTSLQASANPVETLPVFDGNAKLEDVRLREVGLTDLQVVAPLERMRYLDVGDNDIQSIDGLSGLPALRQLYMTNNDIGTLAPLSTADVLRTVDVRGNPSIDDLSPLAAATTIDTLRVGASASTPLDQRPDFDLSPVAGANALGRFVVQWGGADIDFTPISALPFLADVGIIDTPLDATDVAQIVALPNLRFLELSRVGLTDPTALSPATNLQSLRLTGNEISDITVVEQWPLLVELVLADNPDLVDIQAVSLLGSLANLDLRNTGVDDVSALLPNEAFREGDRLDVRGTALNSGDCADLAVLTDRGVDVRTDVEC